MVRCINNQKRDFDFDKPTAEKNPVSAIRIGCDRSINDEISNQHSHVCSISHDLEPICRQSSLLSFFTKVKRAKPRQKPNHTKDKLTSRSCVRSVKTNKVLSLSSMAPSPTLSNHPTTEVVSKKRKAPTSLKYDSKSQSQQKQFKSLTQVYIDCGQSKFGQILCNKCGMLYMPGILEDEYQHKRLCMSYTLGIPCYRGNVKGGKKVDIRVNESDATCINEVTIVSWRPCVRAQKRKKLKEQQEEADVSSIDIINNNRPSQWPLLARMISRDLGTHEETTLDHLTNETVFLYTGKKFEHKKRKHNGANITDAASIFRILGVATVQVLGQVNAYRMISLYERSLKPVTEAKLGIGILWTHPIARHRGIATTLVHTAREHAIFGMRVTRQDVAFSNPTQAGYNFALSYSNSERKSLTNIGTGNKKYAGHQSCNPEDESNNSKRDQDEGKTLCPRSRGPLVYEMNL